MKTIRQTIILLSIFFSSGVLYAQDSLQSMPDYYYRVDNIRVYPDSQLINIEYYDKLDNLICIKENNNTITVNKYENSRLSETKVYKETVAKTRNIHQYFPYQERVNYYNKYGLMFIQIKKYQDSLYQRVLEDKLYDISESDTTLAWVYLTEYDTINRRISWFSYENNMKEKGFEFEYKSSSDSVEIVYIQEFDGEKCLNLSIEVFNKKTNVKTYSNYYYQPEVYTQTKEFYTDSDFLYKTEEYGSINHTCNPNDKINGTQLKTVSEKPDEVIIRKKTYF
jgi:hypothetical protein